MAFKPSYDSIDIMLINLSWLFILTKPGITDLIKSKRYFRFSEWNEHDIRKWNSSSISDDWQNKQVLLCNGVIGLVCLPFSMLRLCELVRNLANAMIWFQLYDDDKYVSGSKTFLNVLYVLNLGYFVRSFMLCNQLLE